MTPPPTAPTETATTDAELIARCAAVIDVPKVAPPDSFLLHAPLELLARAILLRHVPDDVRPLARARLDWLADRYEAAGPGADHPIADPVPEPDDLVCSLAAAGHAPILVSLRPRVPEAGPAFGNRLVATEAARYPEWRLEWPRLRDASGTPSGDLADRLAAPRSPGDPGRNSIYPTMHLTEASGLSAEVLDAPLRGMGVAEARRELLRVAAWSMLQDEATSAPYGWTHCLTLPQAALALADDGTGAGADPDVVVGVAATYVLGFRAVQGRVRLEPGRSPDPESAAGRVWRAPDDEVDEIRGALAAYGAVHPDAHVAKYTLACLDATDDDPDAGRLFLAAAAHLHEWWNQHPVADDPILPLLR